MDQPKSYKTIVATVVLTISMISCSNSNEVPFNDTTSNPEINQKDSVLEVIEETIRPKDSIINIDFDIPEGYKLFDKIEGDLNDDGINDHVLMIKETDESNVVINRFDDEVDRNRRGILIYLSDNGTYILATKNLSCFFSENEDGGVYFPPELSMSIRNNKLYFDYAHGRYGFWQYTFRYQNSGFALIGYDASHNYGPIVNREVSINYLTKKRLTRENVNQDIEESGDEIFEETWDNIEIQELYQLSDIKDFEELDVN